MGGPLTPQFNSRQDGPAHCSRAWQRGDRHGEAISGADVTAKYDVMLTLEVSNKFFDGRAAATWSDGLVQLFSKAAQTSMP